MPISVGVAKEALSILKEALSLMKEARFYWCGKRGTVSIERCGKQGTIGVELQDHFRERALIL